LRLGEKVETTGVGHVDQVRTNGAVVCVGGLIPSRVEGNNRAGGVSVINSGR